MRDLDQLFAALHQSSFRRRFQLKAADRSYIAEKGWPAIQDHARDFVGQRLAPAIIANDGQQTPYRGHRVFVAQHATACCCRGCLQKWHRIESGVALSPDQQQYIVIVLMSWLCRRMVE